MRADINISRFSGNNKNLFQKERIPFIEFLNMHVSVKLYYTVGATVLFSSETSLFLLNKAEINNVLRQPRSTTAVTTSRKSSETTSYNLDLR